MQLKNRLTALENTAAATEPVAPVATFLCEGEHPTAAERHAAHTTHPNNETIFVGRVSARIRPDPDPEHL